MERLYVIRVSWCEGGKIVHGFAGTAEGAAGLEVSRSCSLADCRKFDTEEKAIRWLRDNHGDLVLGIQEAVGCEIADISQCLPGKSGAEERRFEDVC